MLFIKKYLFKKIQRKYLIVKLKYLLSICFTTISGLVKIKFGLSDEDLCNALNFLRRQRNIRYASPLSPPPKARQQRPSGKWSASICIEALEPSRPANCCRIDNSINMSYLPPDLRLFFFQFVLFLIISYNGFLLLVYCTTLFDIIA